MQIIERSRDRLLKITGLYQPNQDYRLQRLLGVHKDFRLSVRDYSHVVDPSQYIHSYIRRAIITIK